MNIDQPRSLVYITIYFSSCILTVGFKKGICCFSCTDRSRLGINANCGICVCVYRADKLYNEWKLGGF